MSYDDSSRYSGDESMHVMHYEDDKDTETEENDTNTCAIESIPKLIFRSNDVDADFEDSDDDAFPSEGSMPKLLIRKEHANEKHFGKEQR